MEILTKNARKISMYKKKLEASLNIKISIRGNKINLEGEQLNEFLAQPVFEAIDAGFSIKEVLLLTDPDWMFEKISIKNFTKRQNLALIRARLIGKHGQTRELIEELSNCFIKIHDNNAYIIGRAEEIKNAINAVTKIIQGSKQSSVYAYLEKQRKIQHDDDLRLKIK